MYFKSIFNDVNTKQRSHQDHSKHLFSDVLAIPLSRIQLVD